MDAHWFVAARWVPVKLFWIVEVTFWNVLSALAGRVRVIRRWSVAPAVSEPRFERARLVPITAREASTLLVAPEQVYVYAGAVPASVHATEQRSITICKPLVESVSSSELDVAVVVSVIEARFNDP